MLQPNMLAKIRKFVPTDDNLQQAFYQLVKSSQMHYVPNSKQFLPTKLPNGLMVASLRYDQKTAQEILGIRYLPIISSKDANLINLLFLYCHQLHSGPFTMHLNKTATNARMREGTYGAIIARAKKIIKTKINKCPTCLKTSKQHTNFDPLLGAPRFISLLESSSPVFLGISFDVLRPLKFLLRRGA